MPEESCVAVPYRDPILIHLTNRPRGRSGIYPRVALHYTTATLYFDPTSSLRDSISTGKMDTDVQWRYLQIG